MNDYINSFLRPKKTSQSERYAIRSSLKSQDTMRMRFTGGLKKNPPQEKISQLDEIVKSYKIDDDIAPKMRMKWKSFQEAKLNEQQ